MRGAPPGGDVDRRDLRGANEGGLSLRLAQFRAGEAERQHRRRLRAAETLAKVRRALGPGVTVNVALPGRQQVNVGTVAVGAGGLPAVGGGETDDPLGGVVDVAARREAVAGDRVS